MYHLFPDPTGAHSALLSDVMQELDEVEHNEDGGFCVSKVMQIHLYPAECANVANMMKSIVSGFVDRECKYIWVPWILSATS